MSRDQDGPPGIDLFADAVEHARRVCASLVLPPGWRWRVVVSSGSEKLLPLRLIASGSDGASLSGPVETSRFIVDQAKQAQAQAWVLALSDEVFASDRGAALDSILQGAAMLAAREGLPPGEAAIRELGHIAEGLPDGWSIELTFRRDEVCSSLVDDEGEEVHVDSGGDGFAANVRTAHETLADRAERSRTAASEMAAEVVHGVSEVFEGLADVFRDKSIE